MIKLYDIIMEQPEDEENSPGEENNPEPPYDTDNGETKKQYLEVEDVLTSLDKDQVFLDSLVLPGDIKIRPVLSTSAISQKRIKILSDIMVPWGQNVPDDVLIKIFEHFANRAIANGMLQVNFEPLADVHKWDIEISLPDVTYYNPNEKFLFHDGMFEISASEFYEVWPWNLTIRVSKVFGSIISKIWGDEIIKNKRIRDYTYDDVQADKKRFVYDTLKLNDSMIPKFPDNFEENLIRVVNKARKIYKLLSKGTYNGKPYQMGNLRMVFLRQYGYFEDERYDSKRIGIDKKTNTVIPNFTPVVYGDLDMYDGRESYDLIHNDYDTYREVKKYLEGRFNHFGIVF